MNEGTLGVHQIKLVVQSGPGLGDGGGVGEHADSSGSFDQIPSRDDGGRLVVDADLEPGGAPVDELDGLVHLDGGDGGVHVLGDDIASVQEAHSHVLA